MLYRCATAGALCHLLVVAIPQSAVPKAPTATTRTKYDFLNSNTNFSSS